MGLLELGRAILNLELPKQLEDFAEIHRLLYLIENYVVLLPFIVNFVEKAQQDERIKEQEKTKGTIKTIAGAMKGNTTFERLFKRVGSMLILNYLSLYLQLLLSY